MSDSQHGPFSLDVLPVSGAPILKTRRADPCLLVLFGSTGDLARHKLYPALHSLMADNALPRPVGLIGVGRGPLSDADLRLKIRDSVAKYSKRKPPEPGPLEALEAVTWYAQAAVDDLAAFRALADKLAALDSQLGTRGNRLFYLATPPDAFPPILRNLRDSGLLYPPEAGAGQPWSRVVLEKPFGHDLDSARELNRLTAECTSESQTFRIDHYLGKETVQNILVFRFGNSIFEPLWNRKYIDHVEITAAEPIGIEGRGAFYDRTGVLRDIVQNHLLQVLTLCAMEPPVSFGADDIREEKVQVLRSLRRPEAETVKSSTVLAQYRDYRMEAGVAPDSRTPTYTALKVSIDNWRWHGVPFYLRAGKRLARQVTEIAVHFQAVPTCLFKSAETCQLVSPNVLRLRLQPDEGISLRFVSKVPGDQLSIADVNMGMTYAEAFGTPLLDAYERLLIEAMRGDASLFARRDELEQSWEFITPILAAWQADPAFDLASYEPGSEGPQQAVDLLARDGRRWSPLR